MAKTGGQTSPTCLSDGRAAGPQHEQGFAASTAAITGEAKRTINQHLARAEALGDDLPRVQGTSLDKGVELDALARLPEPERKDLIARAQAGEKVTARPAPATPDVDERNPNARVFAQVMNEALKELRVTLGCPDNARLAVVLAEAIAEAAPQELRDLGRVLSVLLELGSVGIDNEVAA